MLSSHTDYGRGGTRRSNIHGFLHGSRAQRSWLSGAKKRREYRRARATSSRSSALEMWSTTKGAGSYWPAPRNPERTNPRRFAP